MPLNKPSDLPDILGRSVEDVARAAGSAKTPAAFERLCSTARHEAAHLIAAGYCGASVTGVEIRLTGQPDRYGATGRIHSSENLPCETAFVDLVGWAWEELHGDVKCAAADFENGRRHAREASVPFDDILDEARDFVAHEDAAEVVEALAACILALAPKTGSLSAPSMRALAQLYKCSRANLRSRHPWSRAVYGT